MSSRSSEKIVKITLDQSGKGYHATFTQDGGQNWSNFPNVESRSYWRRFARENGYRLSLVREAATV